MKAIVNLPKWVVRMFGLKKACSICSRKEYQNKRIYYDKILIADRIHRVKTSINIVALQQLTSGIEYIGYE